MIIICMCYELGNQVSPFFKQKLFTLQLRTCMKLETHTGGGENINWT
jgi:hypothetical protein